MVEDHELTKIGGVGHIIIACQPLFISSLVKGLRWREPRGSTMSAPNMPRLYCSRVARLWNACPPSCVSGLMYHSNSPTLPGATRASGLLAVAGLPVLRTSTWEPLTIILVGSPSMLFRSVIRRQSPWLARIASG